MESIKIVLLNNHNFISCDYEYASKLIIDSLDNTSKDVFIHVNLFNYYILNKRFPLPLHLQEKTKLFFEGIGMKSGAFISGLGWNSDVNGTDLYPFLLNELVKRKIPVFCLGSNESVLNSAINSLTSQFPELLISGWQNGYFSESDEEKIVNEINSSEAKLLIAGMGMKREIDFLIRNYSRLNVDAIWNVGGLFDIISGSKSRAPEFIRNIRLEWLYRFFRQPINKFSRNFIIPFWFFFHLLILKLKFNRKEL